MDKKKILLIVSIILIVASIGISIYLVVNKPEEDDEFTIDGINLPNNEEVLKDVIVDSLKITNVSLLTRDGISTFKAEVINESNTDIDINTLNVIFYEGEIETKVAALKDVSISSGGSVYMNIESEIDLSKITKIEYVLE